MALVPFIVLTVLALGLAYVRLTHGPISLSFLVSPIERSINAVVVGYVAQVEDAIVRLTDDKRLEFRLKNVRFAEPDGDLVASSPLASIEISRKGLLQGRLLPSRVELIRPELFLTYTPGKGLGLSFSAPVATVEDGGKDAVAKPKVEVPPLPVGAGGEHGEAREVALLKKIDFGQLLMRATSETRDPDRAASFLREFGVIDAVLHVESQGHRTTWQLPEAGIDLDNRNSHSIISGRARVASGINSWRMAFHIEDENGRQTLRTSVRDLVPSLLFGPDPAGSLLSYIDLPVGADITLALTQNGDVQNAAFDIGLGRGNILLRDDRGKIDPMPFEAGRVKLDYDPSAGLVAIAPSTVHAADMAMTFKGTVKRQADAGTVQWLFDLSSNEGVLGGSGPGVVPQALKQFAAHGRYDTDRNVVVVESTQVEAADARLSANAEISLVADRPGARVQMTTSPMDIATLKAAWPAGIAGKSRTWVAANVLSGTVKKFEFRRESGIYAAEGAGPQGVRSSLVVEADNGAFLPAPSLSPVSFPRALLTLENHRLEISTPDAEMGLGSGKSIKLKGGHFVSEDVIALPPVANVSFKAQMDAMAAIELLRQPPFSMLNDKSLQLKNADGKIDSQLELTVPLGEELGVGGVQVAGKAKLTEGRIQKLAGEYDVQGASVAVDFNNGAVEAKGEAIVRGVLARISWQHIFNAAPERQPPLRITATLDNTDRRQLGLDVDQLVQGVVPVDIQAMPASGSGERKLHVRADLTNAELNLSDLSWNKPSGRNAFAEFDIATLADGRHELQNFRVAGDNIAVEGWVALDASRKLREFYFPDFSLNVVTSLKLQGTLRKDNVWEIKARGSTFDGKDFFRSLFTLGRANEDAGSAKKGGGVDLDAQIDNVLGFSELSLRGVKVKLQSRDGRLSALDARGTLDGGAALAVVLDHDKQGQRRIRADSTDAGRTFKLVGFYPNMQKGRVRLEMNADGTGAADKTGTLWVEDFQVLGDPVISEVVSSGVDDGRPKISGRKKVVREVFEFDVMRVPFSLGHGQFVMDDAYMRGPLLGATIRGKVDFKSAQVNIGGTYIPLQGLNNAFGQIPVLGQILSGPRGEGIFGITFAIQGAMANPQVIVNPLSLVAPGIFREVFQMTNPSPKVQPRKIELKRQRRSIGTSDEPTVKKGGGGSSGGSGATIDGWSSDTKRR
ncbi:MAG: DUF3971 domain-containing protein [Hyphomicrobiaceae bacterium]|nr:DUF3971 domain-containing protein [Hyphomicrobiaceae bacterium]